MPEHSQKTVFSIGIVAGAFVVGWIIAAGTMWLFQNQSDCASVGTVTSRVTAQSEGLVRSQEMVRTLCFKAGEEE